MEQQTRQLSPVEVTRCVMAWFYNNSAVDQALAMFPDAEPSYLREWVDRASRGQLQFFGRLDLRNQRRLVELAIERYGHGVMADSAVAREHGWED